MRNFLFSFGWVLLSITHIAMSAQAQSQHSYYDPWKGHTVTSPLEFGMMTGMNLYGNVTNWSVLMTGAVLIKENGWADDIDNRAWVELQAGPAFFSLPAISSSETGLQYSLHVRWDFTLNEFWTFYGLGGLAGFRLPTHMGDTLTIHPRFGVGAEYQTKVALMFRGEVSAEFIGAGVGFNF